MYPRKLQMNLPQKQSAFLWGARQTGKSSFLKSHYPDSIYYDLLNTHDLIRFTTSPYLLREEVLALQPKDLAQPIIIDEIQKVPELLNEIHWLIENSDAQFILCGSSARKLKTQATNLLGGRAWPYHFYPFVFSEIPQFDLLKALQQGLIPRHYLSDKEFIQEHLQAYIDIYLRDEIRNEGLVRNLAGFARFLEVVGICNGEMINFSNIARDCSIDRTTVQGYYRILIDTLLGYYVYPYSKKVSRDLISAMPKFYLFDVGVANYLGHKHVTDLKGSVAGASLEHFIFMELIAYINITRKRMDISYWRTKTGLEVDFILGDAKVAIEVKISEKISRQDIKGLLAFCEEHPTTQPFVISQDPRPRKLEIMRNDNPLSISILPWRLFLERLWGNEIF